ncbi:hypothetical protein [Pleomorphovibrio marinus]|uniref:hypothetical protein n=1 Tax=Pleomorphovibrio marinus TaxID=2164132 RepID=UPI0013006342|nr:hypothetical protein [Pleomorphovibrio marinus]
MSMDFDNKVVELRNLKEVNSNDLGKIGGTSTAITAKYEPNKMTPSVEMEKR